MLRNVRAVAISAAGVGLAILAQPAVPRSTWLYGGGPEQIRYSPLTQINRANVAQLQVAWTYDTGERGAMQTQPVVVDGVLYGYTPAHKTFAVNAATGAELWAFDSGIAGSGPNRGVMYWAGEDDRRVFAAVGDFIYALDARTGKPIETFGTAGRIDLREDLDRDPALQTVRLTTPGVIYKDLMIVGGRVGETLPTSPGHIRAYDVRTGALRWTFHTIPHPGEFGYATWPPEAWKYGGGANDWAGMALDERRGIVYVATGSAASDFYGADRLGDDLFANCLLALDAATGKRIWHFQFVHHDLWDRDPPAPPSLVTVRRNGRTIDAVAQATKQGFVFLFDRVTGDPLFPIEERPFPASEVPGEVASRTQPVPLAPAPFARQRLTADLLTNRTPESHQWALDRFKTLRSEGQFVPFEVDRPAVVFPGFDGGAEWGGQAFDPDSGLYYINANDLAWTGQLSPSTGGHSGRALFLRHCAACHHDDGAGVPPQIPSLAGIAGRRSVSETAKIVKDGAGRMPGFPTLAPAVVNAIVQFVRTGKDTPAGSQAVEKAHPLIDNSYRFTGYDKFLDPDGYPAVAPPWGTLNAIDLNSGGYAWTVPLGEYPDLAKQGLTRTGSENYGGPIATAGGLVIIAATNHDRKVRAFDKATGALLWEAALPSSGNATPATYEAGGRQFIVITAGGGKSPTGGPGGVYVAFALPAR
ncbi:MAG TPA: pyrroloquinoline quinone-dependent dehydrogenase [Vicinamibacterales bacterium]|nr:pyrroloquinoline quinone-dependent dehydrogenase [Vicinamibacterales bacterium]